MLQGALLLATHAFVCLLQALKAHVESHTPAGANVTLTTLGFKAHPYLMPKDTVINQAAAQVSADHLAQPHFNGVCQENRRLA